MLPEIVKVALADDHKLLRSALAEMISDTPGYTVIFEADNGQDAIAEIKNRNIPDLLLLDIHMPVMDGFETANYLKDNYPDIRILALSMYDNEDVIIKMLRRGVRGYILKDSELSELQHAMRDVMEKDYYLSDLVSGRLVHSLSKSDLMQETSSEDVKINEREMEFLQFACSELTYREIATNMCLSVRTIDGYRDALFEKFHLKTRVGLVLFALKHHLVKLENLA